MSNIITLHFKVCSFLFNISKIFSNSSLLTGSNLNICIVFTLLYHVTFVCLFIILLPNNWISKMSFDSKVSKMVGNCRSRYFAPGFTSDKILYFDVILLFAKTDRFSHAAWLEPNIKTSGFILFFCVFWKTRLFINKNYFYCKILIFSYKSSMFTDWILSASTIMTLVFESFVDNNQLS